MQALEGRLRRLERQIGDKRPLTLSERFATAEKRLAGMTQQQRDEQLRVESLAALAAPDLHGHGIDARIQRAERRMARHFLSTDEVNHGTN